MSEQDNNSSSIGSRSISPAMRHKLLGLEEGSSLNPASRSRRAASGPERPAVMSGVGLTGASLHYFKRVASSKFEVIRRYPYPTCMGSGFGPPVL